MATPAPALVRFTDPAAFLERALPFLVGHEAEHNLLLGIAGQLARRPDAWGDERPYEALVEAGGEIVAAALRTPPFNLALSQVEDRWRDEALDLLVTDLRAVAPALPGVLGLTPIAEAFADRWAGSRTGWRVRQAERIFQLTQVLPPPRVPGAMRPAAPSDRELVARWMMTFSVEALGEDDTYEESLAVVDRWRETGARTLWLWEVDSSPVSMVGTTGETPNGIRIGPVYTPPPLRGHGYASAPTAAVSQAQLDAGRRYCFLFTDLANPTSNHIYPVIGYRPVADVTDIRFTG